MVTTLQAIAAVRDTDSQGKRLHNDVYVILDEDIDYSTLPTITESTTARSMAALTLKDAATGFVKFSMVKYTPAATSEASMGDITSANTNTLTGTLGGKSVEIDNLCQQIGVPCHVVVVDRFTQKKTIYGRPYSPMYLSACSKRENGDNTSCDVTFTQESLFQPLEYLGDLV